MASRLDARDMSNTANADPSTDQTYCIPSILTTSLRVVLEEFGDNIRRLKAMGSDMTKNGEDIESLEKYDVSKLQKVQFQFNIDYERVNPPGADGPINPLATDIRSEMIREMERHMGQADGSPKPDIPVTQLQIRVESNPVQKAANTRTNKFDLTFKSDAAEGESGAEGHTIREQTRLANRDRELYEGLGLNIHNLNLYQLEETAPKLTKQSDPTILSWTGPQDTYPRTRGPQVARAVVDDIIPGQFARNKLYTPGEDEVMKIVGAERGHNAQNQS